MLIVKITELLEKKLYQLQKWVFLELDLNVETI